uniref:Carboxylesterase family protein n=2 Tax=Vibrio algicola TaxID=2662262 RepID=A0A5Q0THU0_9VIBR
MRFMKRTFMAATIALMMTACGGDDTSNTPSVIPDEPVNVQPLPSEVVNLPIGNSSVDAMKESVVIRSLKGELQRVWVESFKGIPYAQATRFEHSHNIELASEVNATEFGDVCPQLRVTAQAQSEACLNINVWRPAETNIGDELPVYVFIHGGDFEYGSGSDPLVHGDTVVAQGKADKAPFMVVSFNYRLGLLGTRWVKGAQEPNRSNSGNYAIGDQKNALKWVNDNITQFGGDTNNVTVMGQGAGAMSVGLLQLSDTAQQTSKELFQRAIMQSDIGGFSYPTYDQAEATLKAAKKSSNELYGTEDIASLESYQAILEIQRKLLNPVAKLESWLLDNVSGVIDNHGSSMSTSMPFAPYIEHKDNLLTTYPGFHIRSQPGLNRDGFSVPTVIGSNHDESNTMSMLPNLASLILPVICELKTCSDDAQFEVVSILEWLKNEENTKQLDQRLLGLSQEARADIDLKDLLEQLDPNVYQIITHLFFGLSNDTAEQVLALTDYAKNDEHHIGGAVKNIAQYRRLMNDMLFAGPARQKAIETNPMNSSTFYQFDYKPSFNVWGYNPAEDNRLDILSVLNMVSCISGACNASELPFVFNKPYTVNGLKITPSNKDKALMANMSRLWFSDALFEDFQYRAESDSVLVIEESGDFSTLYEWDKRTQKGLDPELREGRLTGLSDAGILLGYMH